MNSLHTPKPLRRGLTAIAAVAAIAAPLVDAVPASAGAADPPPTNVLSRNGQLTELPDVPGATATAHAGLNDRGDTVGIYLDANGSIHGFLFERRTATLENIDVPGAQITLPYDINNRGQIVGTYIDAGAVPEPSGVFPPGAQHAYLWENGTVTIVDPPDTVYTPNAYGLNDRGDIVGVRADANLVQFGYLRTRDGAFITLDPPGAAENKALGINNRGQVVGGYLDDTAAPGPDGLFDPGTVHGYIWDRGEYQRLDVPDARATAAFKINDRGDVVGEVKDRAGQTRGFLQQRGRYQFVDGPGDRNNSLAIDVNQRGEVLIPAPESYGVVNIVR